MANTYLNFTVGPNGQLTPSGTFNNPVQAENARRASEQQVMQREVAQRNKGREISVVRVEQPAIVEDAEVPKTGSSNNSAVINTIHGAGRPALDMVRIPDKTTIVYGKPKPVSNTPSFQVNYPEELKTEWKALESQSLIADLLNVSVSAQASELGNEYTLLQLRGNNFYSMNPQEQNNFLKASDVYNSKVEAFNASSNVKFLNNYNQQVNQFKGVEVKAKELQPTLYATPQAYDWSVNPIHLGLLSASNFYSTQTANIGRGYALAYNWASGLTPNLTQNPTNPQAISNLKTGGEYARLGYGILPYFLPTPFAVGKGIMDIGASEKPLEVLPSVVLGLGVGVGLRGAFSLARLGASYLPQESKLIQTGYDYASRFTPYGMAGATAGFTAVGSAPIVSSIASGQYETAKAETSQFSFQLAGWTLGGLAGNWLGGRAIRPYENLAGYNEGVNKFSAGFKINPETHEIKWSEAQPENLDLFKKGYIKAYDSSIKYSQTNEAIRNVESIKNNPAAQEVVLQALEKFKNVGFITGSPAGYPKEVIGALRKAGVDFRGAGEKGFGDIDYQIKNPFITEKKAANLYKGFLEEKGYSLSFGQGKNAIETNLISPTGENMGKLFSFHGLFYRTNLGEGFQSFNFNAPSVMQGIENTSGIGEIYPNYLTKTETGIKIVEPQTQWKRKLEAFRGKDVVDIKAFVEGTKVLASNGGISSLNVSKVSSFVPKTIKSYDYKSNYNDFFKSNKNNYSYEKSSNKTSTFYAKPSESYAYKGSAGYLAKSSYASTSYVSPPKTPELTSPYLKKGGNSPTPNYPKIPTQIKPNNYPKTPSKITSYPKPPNYVPYNEPYSPKNPNPYKGVPYKAKQLEILPKNPKTNYDFGNPLKQKFSLKVNMSFGKPKGVPRWVPIKSNPITKVITGGHDLPSTPRNMRLFESLVARKGANYAGSIPTLEQVLHSKHKSKWR